MLPPTNAPASAPRERREILSAFVSLGTVFAAFLLASCIAPKPPPRVTLPSTGPDAELVKRVPVVDIHTHTFNARFLPVRNLALGKRDVYPPFSWLPDPAVIAIADWIVRNTGVNLTRLSDAARVELLQDVATKANRQSAELEGTSIFKNEVTGEDLQKDPRITGITKIAAGSGNQLNDDEQAGLQRFARMFADHKAPAGEKEKQNEIVHFFSCLMAGQKAMVGLFQRDHQDPRDHQDQVALMVSHMMDLAPTYNQKEGGDRLIRFAEQIERVHEQQENAKGRMIYFVAYNPFRDHFDNGRTGTALEIVRKAYNEEGAFGVKVYPPSGYTPAANVIPRIPWTIARQPREQWKARYKPGGVKLTGDDLDKRLLELLRWCVRHHVPVFTHSGEGEVEARKRYGKMANPAFWRELLDQHPELRELRLCLGHAGGGTKFWFGSSDSGPGYEAFRLCADYPNVYCEFAMHDSIVDPDKRARFSQNLCRLIKESRAKHEYDFSTKIPYGSDWYMPMFAGSDRVNYLNAFRDAILHVNKETDATERLYKGFFYRNAVNFLNVKKRLTRGGLPVEVREPLNDLLER